ncbi:MAG TPA: hypothetical protein VJA26_08190, partial [Gammaproteobacteria bacterium]|nr:hypothetical protein [Gammaproteobacteria bacterium]
MKTSSLMRSCKRLGAFAVSCCSVRSVLAIPVGLMLGLLPLTSGPASSGVLPLPYLPRSAHQAYGYGLAQTRLAQNVLGQQWLAAAERALLEPERIVTPFEAASSFAASAPSARSYAFAVRDGQRVRVEAQPQTNEQLELFVDLFRATAKGLEQVASGLPVPPTGEAALRPIEVEVFEPAEYVLRVQPALARIDR